MSTFTDIEWIDPKDWNKKLTEMNGGKRARYFEIWRYFSKDNLPDTKVTEVFWKWDFCDKSKAYYTVSIKDRPGNSGQCKVIIRVADNFDKDGYYRPTEQSNLIASKIYGKELNPFHSYTAKLTTLSKAAQDAEKAVQVLKDHYGVPIELGDYVAHPSGSYGGGSWVEVSRVCSFGVGTVNSGWRPERLIVVKSDNKNKKLGWLPEE